MVTPARPLLTRWVELLPQRFEENLDLLNTLDAQAGDGDHGTTMLRAARAAADAVSGDPQAGGKTLLEAGAAFRRAAGGAAGPLFSSILTELGKAAGEEPLSAARLAEGLQNAAATVARLGRSGPGDRTMLDALLPAAEAASRGDTLEQALSSAVRAAEDGAAATVGMRASKGRARYANDGLSSVEDAGARSVVILLTALRDVGGPP